MRRVNVARKRKCVIAAADRHVFAVQIRCAERHHAVIDRDALRRRYAADCKQLGRLDCRGVRNAGAVGRNDKACGIARRLPGRRAVDNIGEMRGSELRGFDAARKRQRVAFAIKRNFGVLIKIVGMQNDCIVRTDCDAVGRYYAAQGEQLGRLDCRRKDDRIAVGGDSVTCRIAGRLICRRAVDYVGKVSIGYDGGVDADKREAVNVALDAGE